MFGYSSVFANAYFVGSYDSVRAWTLPTLWQRCSDASTSRSLSDTMPSDPSLALSSATLRASDSWWALQPRDTPLEPRSAIIRAAMLGAHWLI